MKAFIPLDHQLSSLVNDAIRSAYPDEEWDSFSAKVVKTADARHGDYQCNEAMPLAKKLRSNPRQIAQKLVEAIGENPLLAHIEIAGPGFINFTLDAVTIAEAVKGLESDDTHGVPQIGAAKTVVIDYSSPNVAKPMHIGHIRSTVIGNALDRLHRALGYKVLSDNHLGDWGTQFGLLIMGFRNFVDQEALAAEPVQELERIYVASYNQSKEDETWLESAKAELVKLQQGDEENRKLWERFIDLSLQEFEKIYSRLDVTFDLVRGESFYNDALPGMLEKLDAAGLLEESDGAQVVNLEDEKLGVCIVRKTDGGFNYATTDLATVQSRVDEFDPAAIIYVTDERQQRHFNQFFSVSEKLWISNKLVHVWFGLMRLPEATFSTREGNVIKLEVLLDEAEKRALDMVKTASPGMDEAQQRDVARAVGIGAIKYADLSQNPQSLVTFTWEKAMALDGNSAPYLQYAHARICSVLDKFADQFPETNLDDADLVLEQDIEKAIGVKLCQFPEAVLAATQHYRPNFLADYLYELAQLNSTLYQTVPFLKADSPARESRMRLIRQIARTLRTGLGLLGIEAPERI